MAHDTTEWNEDLCKSEELPTGEIMCSCSQIGSPYIGLITDETREAVEDDGLTIMNAEGSLLFFAIFLAFVGVGSGIATCIVDRHGR